MGTRIAVLGASGRMGIALLRALRDNHSAILSGALVSKSNAQLGNDAGEPIGWHSGVPLVSDIKAALANADVAIDVTLPEATLSTLDACVEAGCALLIGTTGLTSEHQAAVKQAAKTIPLLLAPNFSAGINMLVAALRKIAGSRPDWGIEIIECHHTNKRDKPSGTALYLAKIIADERGQPVAEVCIRSLRTGDTAGEHRVIMTGPSEKLELTHRADDRQPFARGALTGGAWLASAGPGLYQMSDVFGL